MADAKGVVGGALYGAFGASEALRRHGQMRMELMKMKMQRQQFQEQMALERYQAETGAVAQAKSLAMEWKKFNEARAAERVRIDLAERELDEKRRQFDLELPVKKKQAETGALRVDAYGRSVDAKAAYDKAKAAALQKGAITPSGLLKQYSDAFKNGYNQFMANANLTFAQLRTNPKLKQQALEHAKEYARVQIGEGLMAYNNFAEFGVVTPMAIDDLEAKADERELTNPDTMPQAQEEAQAEVQKYMKDKTFGPRFNSGKLTAQEEAMIEVLSHSSPEWNSRFQRYKALKEKLDADSLGGLVEPPDEPTVTPHPSLINPQGVR